MLVEPYRFIALQQQRIAHQPIKHHRSARAAAEKTKISVSTLYRWKQGTVQ